MPLECFYTLPNSLEEHRVIWKIEPRLQSEVEVREQLKAMRQTFACV